MPVGRSTYRHGSLSAAAIEAGYAEVAASGHQKMSLRRTADRLGVAHRSLYNHFNDREDLLNHVAAEGYRRLRECLAPATDARGYIQNYVSFALREPGVFALMASRPHGTMFQIPALQEATHQVIAEAMRVFASPEQDPAEKRRRVMKIYMLLFGGITLYTMGILDLSGEAALVDELVAMVTLP